MNENEQQPQLVTNLIEAAQYLVNQYNNVISKTDRDDVQGVIEQLQVHDRNASNHIAMMDRRIGILSKRIGEAKGQPDRLDIPWVRQELSMLKWMKART